MLPGDLIPVPLPKDQVVPVEEWDWAEIDRIDHLARERLRRCSRCEICGTPMVLAQIRTHHCCRPDSPTVSSQRARLGSR